MATVVLSISTMLIYGYRNDPRIMSLMSNVARVWVRVRVRVRVISFIPIFAKYII